MIIISLSIKDLACKSDAKKPSYSYYLAVIERRRIASNFQIRSDMCGECKGSGSSPLQGFEKDGPNNSLIEPH